MPCSALQTDDIVSLVHPVSHLSSMMGGERIERPVGIRYKPDASLRAEKNRHFGGVGSGARSRFGGFQQVCGGLYKTSHTNLIGAGRYSVNP